MNTYNIKVTDTDTGQPIGADIYYLDGPNGSGIINNGIPVVVQTGLNGEYSFTTSQPVLYVRVQSTGYVSQNVTLSPGNNNIQLGGVNSAGATITASRTFWNKYKPLILLLLVMALLFIAVKYKALV